VLLRRALERGLSETSVYRYLWNYARGLRAPGALFAEEQGERDFWRHISTEDLSYRVTNALPIFWEALLPHQFASWLSLDEAPPLPSGAARTIPLDATMAAIERRGLSVFSEEALEPFLARAKAKVALVLERAITSGDSATVEHILLRTSPAATATVSAALPRAPVLLQTKPPILRAVRTYLLRAVRERHTGFEACFDLLAEVERGVGPLRQLP
jgi:hypothetical protein